MTLSTFNLAPNYTSDALFRTDASAIDTAIRAVGMVQTSDTGQINFSTVTRATPAFTAAGYAIYRFNDSNQGSYPCYIKVEYGCGTTALTTLAIWVTIGTGTNGAGTLTGAVSTRIQLSCSAASAGPFTSGASGSTSRLTLALNTNGGTSYAQWISIERLQTAAGADSTTGLCVVAASRALGASGNWNQVLYYSGNQPPMSNCIGALMINMPVATSWLIGTDVGTGPISPIGWGVHPPIRGGLAYFNADLTTQNQFSISVYGSAGNYFSIGSGNIGTLNLLVASASILTRWEQYDPQYIYRVYIRNH